MSLENTVAKYEVQITRTGNGTAEASKEFQQLDKVVQVTNAALREHTNRHQELHEATRATTATFHELHTVGLLIGMEMFPQMTIGIQATVASMHAVRAVSIATGASLGVVGAALAGLVGIVATATQVWELYHAKAEAKESAENFEKQQELMRNSITKTIDSLRAQGRITDELAVKIQEQAESDPRGAMVELQGVKGTSSERQAVADLADLRAKLIGDTLTGYAKEDYQAHQNFLKRREEIEELAAKGGDQVNGPVLARTNQLNQQAFAAEAEEISRKRLAAESDDAIKGFERDLTTTALTQSETRIQQAEREYDQKVRFYQQLYEQGKITEDKLVELDRQATDKRLQELQKADQQYKVHIKSWSEMIGQIEEQFASGMADAIVSFVDHTKSAKQAFQDFAKSFLESIAKMIIQNEILVGIKAAGEALAFGGGGSATADALGGVHYAAAGLSGVYSVSSPTYFPKFNVVAGEAGREMLTVLARPRQMAVGGLEAVVGRAGGSTLAITDANALAARNGGAGGASGHIHIEISHSEQSEARIVDQAILGSEVHITKRMAQNSGLRAAIRKTAKS